MHQPQRTSAPLHESPAASASYEVLAPYLRLTYAKACTWREQALCAQVDPELFFPDQGGTTATARSICQRCPVRTQCLEAALQEEDGTELTLYGVRGGMSATEREAVLRKRRDARWRATGRHQPEGVPMKRTNHGRFGAAGERAS